MIKKFKEKKENHKLWSKTHILSEVKRVGFDYFVFVNIHFLLILIEKKKKKKLLNLKKLEEKKYPGIRG